MPTQPVYTHKLLPSSYNVNSELGDNCTEFLSRSWPELPNVSQSATLLRRKRKSPNGAICASKMSMVFSARSTKGRNHQSNGSNKSNSKKNTSHIFSRKLDFHHEC